jgi:hypothetical protein
LEARYGSSPRRERAVSSISQFLRREKGDEGYKADTPR